MLALLVVGYTPIVPQLMRGLERSTPLSPAPAVVVLADEVLENGTPSTGSQDRILRGYEILRGNYASTLVLTRPSAPGQAWTQQVRSQMSGLGLDFPIVEVGPVTNTHDEALCVSELARQKGWSQIILVTHAWHMRRAAATFEKAGVKVIGAPCVERTYDITHLNAVEDRFRAFNKWVHETIGYQIYRWRGWIS